MRPIEKIKTITAFSSGFTLIEMAVVLMIMGIAVVSFTPLYKLHLEHKAIETTQSNVDNVTAAISSFRAVNGRYPCPSSLTAVRGDNNYGYEDCTNYNGVINPGTCDTGAAGTGICREQSERSITYLNPFVAGNPPITANPTIRVGTLPFRDLNIDEKKIYDGYNNRVVYAITENLMFDATFRGNQGGIEIFNNATTPASVLTPAASAHFVVLSQGKNGNGAYTRSGVQLNCPAASVESANCDTTVNSRYTLTQHNSVLGATEFDDIMTYFTQSEVPLWQFSSQQRGDIMQKPGGDVGMNFSASSMNFVGDAAVPNSGTKQAQINGALRATDDTTTGATEEGRVMADDLCHSSGVCFQTSVIAGTVAAGEGMRCPTDDPDGTGQYMVGVANNAPICEDDLPMPCPPGQLMAGINPKGRIICKSNIQCPEITVLICDQKRTLAASAPSTVVTVEAGLTAYASYYCTNSGSWKNQNVTPAGMCTCAPEVDQTNNNMQCGPGFSDTFTQTRTHKCPVESDPNGTMAKWNAWEPSNYTGAQKTWTYPPEVPCACVGDTDTRNVNCTLSDAVPSVATQTRTFNCTGQKSGKWSNWSPPNAESTCACPAQFDNYKWVDCGGNNTSQSKKQVKKTFNTKTCKWSAPVDIDITNCKCTEWDELRNAGCLDGYSGSRMMNDHYNCPSGVTTTPVSDTCAPPPPRTCSWESTSNTNQSDTTQGGVRKGSDCSDTCDATRPTCYTGSVDNYQIYYNCVCK